MFKWAKNATEVIHDTTKHIHFESTKIIDSIPGNIKSNIADSTDMKAENSTKDCDVRDTEADCESLGHSDSILDILTAEEFETPLIKDHLQMLKTWQKEDSDENTQHRLSNSKSFKLVRWFERLNALKKSYIVTKSENILPFQLTIPQGALQTGKIYLDLKIRLNWVANALPGANSNRKSRRARKTNGNISYIFIQPIYKNDENVDLSQLSGYIYLRQDFKTILRHQTPIG